MSSFWKNQLTWATEAGILAGSLYWQNEGLLLIAVVGAWLSNAVRVLAILVLFVSLNGGGKLEDSKTIMEMLAQLGERSSLQKAITRFQVVALIMGFAYAGAPVTAFFIAVLSAVLYAGLNVARDRMKGVSA